MRALLRTLGFIVFLFAVAGGGALTVGQSIDAGGRAYVDYFYNVSDPSPADEGLHGFRYRRLYLTTDFTLSEAFAGRARLEADDGTLGRPFVKDLYLTWSYSGAHSATIGVTSPPAFGIADDFWGYRSLDKTLMDLQDIADSRDFGLRLDGPLATNGQVGYAVMLANNSGTQPEADKYKRIYGQLSANPSESLTLVVGADYAAYGDQRENGTRLSVFAGYDTGWGRVGVEGYWYGVSFAGGGDLRDVGGSVFGVVPVASEWELIARLDRSGEFRPGPDRYETYVLTGIAYQPHSNVALIPNLRVRDPSDAAATVTGRFTLEVQF